MIVVGMYLNTSNLGLVWFGLVWFLGWGIRIFFFLDKKLERRIRH